MEAGLEAGHGSRLIYLPKNNSWNPPVNFSYMPAKE